MSAVSPERASELLAAGAQPVDVREAYEYEAGHIAGARHIDLAQLATEAGTLDGAVVFYCRSGERSAMADEAFEAAGREAYTVDGGLLAWVEAGLPLDPDDGTVAERSVAPSQ
jgi:rhodanese-related sulfurtransferase